MSVLYNEYNVDVLGFTLQRKDGTGTGNFYFTYGDFQISDWVSSFLATSRLIWPLLSKPVRIEREVGTTVAIRHTLNIQLFSKTDFQKVGYTFLDILKTYELQGGDIVIYHFVRPTDAAISTTGYDARQRAEITGFSHNEEAGIVTIEATETWFKDKELSKTLTTDIFSGLDTNFQGEAGAIVFGDDESTNNGVIIDSPFINSTDIFTGWRSGGHQYDAAQVILAKNEFKQFQATDWVTLDLTSTPDTARYGALTTAGNVGNLAQYDRGLIVAIANPLAGSEVLMFVKTRLRKQGTVNADKGELAMRIYFSVNNLPAGPALRTVTMDPSTLTTSFAEYTFHLDVPLVMTEGEIYLVTFEWSNRDDTVNRVDMDIDTAATGVSYAIRDKTTTDQQNWATGTGIRHSIALYMLGYDTWESGVNSYSYYRLKPPTGTTTDIRDIRFKFGLKGLQDDSSGTATGTPNRLLDNPAHIILFLLRDTSIGVAPSPIDIDNSAILAVGSKLDDIGIRVGISIDESMSVSELITRLCRHYRMRLYKERNGKLTLNFPNPISDLDYTLCESKLGSELTILNESDNDYSTVINSFKSYYRRDVLDLDHDPSGLRKPKPDKMAEQVQISADDPDGDNPMGDELDDSVTKYGDREFNENLTYTYSESTAKFTRDYIVQRYHKLQQRLNVQLLRKDFQAIDLFDTIKVEHTSLPSKAGNSYFLYAHDVGTPRPVTYGGVTSIAWCGGSFVGEVVGIEEEGPFINVTIESVGSFEKY
jgi:hypothetical protein